MKLKAWNKMFNVSECVAVDLTPWTRYSGQAYLSQTQAAISETFRNGQLTWNRETN
jgi:hypothetical protein